MMAGSTRGSSSWYSCPMCRPWCKALKWLPVILILSIVVWSYFAYVYQLCFWAVDNVFERVLYLIPYHILLILFMWAYIKTVISKIVPVPDKFKLPVSEMEKLLATDNEDVQRQVLEQFARDLPIVTRTMSGSVRYCNRCMLVKPDRAHHCSMCGVCILKMDHHCPWVNNCVCFHNYKYFMLFLGYALAYCIFVLCTVLPYFIQFWKRQLTNLTANSTGQFHVVFVFFVALMFGISLGSLFGYHCYLVCHNRTTLESFRAPVFRSGPDKRGFDIGSYNNFKEVFGRKPALWFLPVWTSLGDGCSFPVRSEHRALPGESRGYDAMGTTRSSAGEGISYPQPTSSEDAESLLSTGPRWQRSNDRLDSSCDEDEWDRL